MESTQTTKPTTTLHGLNEDEILLLLEGLGELHAKKSFGLIVKITNQTKSFLTINNNNNESTNQTEN